jgi:hypothetical protein
MKSSPAAGPCDRLAHPSARDVLRGVDREEAFDLAAAGLRRTVEAWGPRNPRHEATSPYGAPEARGNLCVKGRFWVLPVQNVAENASENAQTAMKD